MACSYRGLTASGEIRPDASCRIASTSSGGLGMLPIGSVGIAMRAILSASRPLSNGRRVWVGSADHWMVECVLHRLASTGGQRTLIDASATALDPRDRFLAQPNPHR